MAGKWHVSNKSSGLFNVVCLKCKKDKCSPKDQKKIAANKNKFSKQKQNSGETSRSNDSHNYNQNIWGAPKNGNGVKLFENKLM